MTELKPGDRVRLTLEGEVVRHAVSGQMVVVQLDGTPPCKARSPSAFTLDELAAGKIELIAPPIAVGDWATSTTGIGFSGPVLAIHGDWAWLGDRDDAGVVRRLSSCRPVRREDRA